MNHGRIAQIGTAPQIYRRPANAFVADFIGKANFLAARVVGVADGHLDLMVLGRPLSLPPGDEARRVGESATLLARPEAVRFGAGKEAYPGRIARAAYLGPTVEYEVDVAGETLLLTQYDPESIHGIGTEVQVKLVTEALYLLPKE
jgi:ABC-type Fe3+/spermidine/putrescine transport system ATPase subunit